MGIGSLLGGSLFALGLGVPFFVAAAVGFGFALAALPGLRAAGRRSPPMQEPA